MYPTIAEYAAAWSRALDLRLDGRSAANYRALITNHVVPKLGAVRLDELRREDVRALLIELAQAGFSRSSVHNVLTAISSLCWCAVDAGLLKENPTLGAGRRLFRRPRRGHAQGKARSREEVAQLLAALEDDYPQLYPLLRTCAETGLRIGEALGLQPGDLDVGRRQLRVTRQWVHSIKATAQPKHGEYRTIEVPQSLALYLGDLAARCTGEWLFPSSRTPTRPWCVMYVERVVKDVAAQLGLPPTTPHALRHSYATIVLEESRDLAYVSKQLGHSSVDITLDLYAAGAVLRHPRALQRLDAAVAGKRHGQVRKPLELVPGRKSRVGA